MEVHGLIEGRLQRDRVDAEEAVTGAHVLVTHGAEVLLTGRVEDVEDALLVVDRHLLAIGVLERRIIVV